MFGIRNGYGQASLVVIILHRHNCTSIGQLVCQIFKHKTLELPEDGIDQGVKDFIAFCCVWDKNARPTAAQLLDHEFLN